MIKQNSSRSAGNHDHSEIMQLSKDLWVKIYVSSEHVYSEHFTINLLVIVGIELDTKTPLLLDHSEYQY